MTVSMDQPKAPGPGEDAVRAVEAPRRHPSVSGPDGRAHRRTSLTLLVLVFVGFVSLGLPDGLLGVAWPSIRQTFGLPLDALGILFLTTVAGYLTASLASGWVVARIGVGMLLALSAFSTALSLLTFALAPAWGPIVAAGLLAGLGGGAIDAGLNSYVALAHSPRLLSWLHACFGVGAATGPAIMMAVLDAGRPWGLGYAIVGGGQLLLGACFLLTRRQWQMAAAAGAPAADRPSRRGAPSARPSRSHAPLTPRPAAVAVWLSVALFLVYTGVETTAGQWAYTVFVEGRGVAAQAAGFGVSAYWGALAAGRVLAGLIANRIAPDLLTRAAMLGMVLGAVLIWLDLAPGLSFAGLVLMGLAAAPVFPTLIAVTPARFGAGRAATIIGFQVAAASLGIAGLPALAGVLAARIDLEVIPLLLVVSAISMLVLHEAVLTLARKSAAAGAAQG